MKTKRYFWLLLPICYVIVRVTLLKIGEDYLITQPKTTITSSAAKEVAVARKRSKALFTVQLDSVDAQFLLQSKQQQDQIIKQAGIGRLAIPSQKVSLPILAGRTDANLSVGAAEYDPHQKMGHGNYVLASHNYAGADVLLNRIKNLAAGQKIYLTDFSQIFMYQVTLR